jgi:hypothetical protein
MAKDRQRSPGLQSLHDRYIGCRLESADYDGHSLTMLGRIAKAVGKRVEVNFVAAD